MKRLCIALTLLAAAPVMAQDAEDAEMTTFITTICENGGTMTGATATTTMPAAGIPIGRVFDLVTLASEQDLGIWDSDAGIFTVHPDLCEA